MVIKLPVEILTMDRKGCHLKVHIEVNGVRSAVIIDTGASNTVFDKNSLYLLAPDEKADKIESVSTAVGSNNLETHTANISVLGFGEHRLKNYKAVLLDLSNINEAFSMAGLSPVIGILGGDLLMKWKASIDYGNKTLKLRIRKNKSNPD